MPHETISVVYVISPFSNTNTTDSQTVEVTRKPEPTVMRLGTYILPPEAMSTLHFVEPFISNTNTATHDGSWIWNFGRTTGIRGSWEFSRDGLVWAPLRSPQSLRWTNLKLNPAHIYVYFAISFCCLVENFPSKGINIRAGCFAVWFGRWECFWNASCMINLIGLCYY